MAQVTDHWCHWDTFRRRHRQKIVEREKSLGRGWFVRHWIEACSVPRLDPDTGVDAIDGRLAADWSLSFVLPTDMMFLYGALLREEAWNLDGVVSSEQRLRALARCKACSGLMLDGHHEDMRVATLIARSIMRHLVRHNMVGEVREWYLVTGAFWGGLMGMAFWKVAVWSENFEAVSVLLDASASEPAWSESWAVEIGLSREDEHPLLELELPPKPFVTDRSWDLLDMLVSAGRINPKSGEFFKSFLYDMRLTYGRNVTSSEIRSFVEEHTGMFMHALLEGNARYALRMLRVFSSDPDRQREMATMEHSLPLLIAVALGDIRLARALYRAGASPEDFTAETDMYYDDRMGPCTWCREVQEVLHWGYPCDVQDVPLRRMEFYRMKDAWEHRHPVALWSVACLRERRERSKRQRETFE